LYQESNVTAKFKIMAESSAAHHDPLNPNHLFGHVQDADHFDVPKFLVPSGEIKIYQPFYTGEKTLEEVKGVGPFERFDLKITKFMLIELAVAIIVALVFIRLGQKMRKSEKPKGRSWNMLEAMVVFIRDEVARPAIGHHDADKFLPLLWTLFFFVLGCNLFGLLPWSGSPTAALATTGALALVTFFTVTFAGMGKMGVVGFWTGQVPHLDLAMPIKILLWPMLFFIEIFGMFIKHFVLAIRLLANMMGGHMVLAVITTFIVATAGHVVFWGVMPASVLGATALSLLELFVGFLQAYIFTFLSALFIGMAVHPH
jgi:F-type H+-transporting ATPase subunit a